MVEEQPSTTVLSYNLKKHSECSNYVTNAKSTKLKYFRARAASVSAAGRRTRCQRSSYFLERLSLSCSNRLLTLLLWNPD